MTCGQKSAVTLLGVPYDANSSFLRGPAEAPAKIREALHSDSSNGCAESGVNVRALLQDAGDVAFDEASAWMESTEQRVSSVLAEARAPLVLGGDHSISYPVVKAVAPKYPNLTILHFDAHPDLYDEFEGNRYSHACPFARIMEARLARRLVQVGIRTMNDPQRAQAKRFGVEVIEMAQWTGKLPQLASPLYVSFDLDVIDPAFAPGVSHHEPGGMNVREAIAAIQSLGAQIVGADIVELNPRRDTNGVTATVAAKLLREIAAKMIF